MKIDFDFIRFQVVKINFVHSFPLKVYFSVKFQQRHLILSVFNMMKIKFNLMLFNKISVMTHNPI